MNNKRKGMDFEKAVCGILAKNGYWVHFITPDARGAQPFDIIAVKNGSASAMDCKTAENRIFPLSRLEDNQITSFDKWLACGNREPLLVIQYQGEIRIVRYSDLRKLKKVNLNDPQQCADFR